MDEADGEIYYHYMLVVKALAESEGLKPCNCGMAIGDEDGDCLDGCALASFQTKLRVGSLVTEETLCQVRMRNPERSK
jgi:hypothetical protein